MSTTTAKTDWSKPQEVDSISAAFGGNAPPTSRMD
jgi:hypothetical protein